MLRNLRHITAPLTLIRMLSVKVKSSHDAHFGLFVNKNTMSELFHLFRFILRLKTTL